MSDHPIVEAFADYRRTPEPIQRVYGHFMSVLMLATGVRLVTDDHVMRMMALAAALAWLPFFGRSVVRFARETGRYAKALFGSLPGESHECIMSLCPRGRLGFDLGPGRVRIVGETLQFDNVDAVVRLPKRALRRGISPNPSAVMRLELRTRDGTIALDLVTPPTFRHALQRWLEQKVQESPVPAKAVMPPLLQPTRAHIDRSFALGFAIMTLVTLLILGTMPKPPPLQLELPVILVYLAATAVAAVRIQKGIHQELERLETLQALPPL